ncbi:MAG: PHP domain-containing protein [Candidatus Poseidoniaceae archaeon]|jgi:hypothetical protein|nr:PHP domain-containing protein [Candidatus Poseidoniaceae archaeon]
MWTEAVDLHSHSHHSDGLFSPAEMAKRAFQNGVKVWSLTDHDTIAGWDEAEVTCNKLGIRFVPGVEITCEVEIISEEKNPSSWHLLAYFPEECNPEFEKWLNNQKNARIPRMKAMIAALNEMGINVKFDEVNHHAEGSIGRPHLARVLVEKGIVTSVSEAFETLIGDECPAYRSRPLPSISEAAKIVHSCGGITSLAHPKYYGISIQKLVNCLIENKIDCVEAFHSSHSEKYRYDLIKTGLPVTVGGDSHGTENRPSPGRALVIIKHLHPQFHP